ncbi:SIR2 family protein [Gimesia fumaroli]|uniref:NAD-dependent protein deacetylase sirtuin-4 n=1 Tax=Gimesia fumaroli TaxID=2527976 RepID=A0A518IAF3_9PLAN|nr:SIR2 family protein [Gimesia fumaroli]QDV50022.1 NAD-dependent protein deacetylase sirtuin-4 [Gimesia fumaroli]
MNAARHETTQKKQPSVRDLDTTNFICQIRTELAEGNGFVPLLGAGVSVGSGVPIISEVRAYLAKCLKLALGVGLQEQDRRKRRWYPRTDAWPQLQNIRLQDAHHAFDEIVAEIHKKRESSYSAQNESQVFEEAIGALADWRSLLLLLSRLEYFPESTAQTDKHTCQSAKKNPTYILRLGPPNYDVIDSFFHHITSGKRPCLVHSMIAQLASPMRFEVVLTTNLDELTEEAFREAGEPLDPVEVHLSAGIPTASSSRDRILIKLHGGRYGVRADYSLDDEPTLKEKENFASYFWRHTQESTIDEDLKFSNSEKDIKNHAFILGTSGNDRRVVELLKYTVKRQQEDQPQDSDQSTENGKSNDTQNAPPKIFWVCYTERDQQEVKAAFQDSNAEVYTVTQAFLGAFLLQLFQSVTCSLPPKSAPFPSSASFSFPPGNLTPKKIQQLNDLIHAGIDISGSKVSETADSLFHDEKRVHTEKIRECRLLRLTALPDQHGVVSKGIHHFYRAMSKQRQCVWMSMEHIGSTDELFEILTDAVAKTAGLSDWMPIVLYDQSEKAVGEIRRLTQGRKEWVIFIDARDGAGSSRCDMDDKIKSNDDVLTRPNGWLDRVIKTDTRHQRTELDDPSSNANDFADLLARVSGLECQNVNLVLLYHAYLTEKDDEEEHIPSPLHQFLNSKKLGRCIQVEDGYAFQTTNLAGTIKPPAGPYDSKEINTKVGIIQSTSLQQNFTQEKTAKQGLKWARNKDKATFLLALCLADRFRYADLLLSDAFFPPESLHPSKRDDSNQSRRRYKLIFGDANQDTSKNIGWINELADAEKCLVRRMPGNFTWMHAPARNYLRKYFHKKASSNAINNTWDVRNSKTVTRFPFACFRAHYLIANWYDKLFRSSGDPLAGLEGVTHYLNAAYEAFQMMRDNQAKKNRKSSVCWTPPKESSDVPVVPHEQIIVALTAARLLLQEVEPAASVTGYPKATCRRLVYIREKLLKTLHTEFSNKTSPPVNFIKKDQLALENAQSLIHQMVLRALYIKRGIAREVSEHNRGFFRHRQIREYLLTHKITVNKFMPETTEEFDEIKNNRKQTWPELLKSTIWKKWLKSKTISTGELHLLNEFASWYRHGGILSLATRGYPATIRQLNYAYQISCSVIRDRKIRAFPEWNFKTPNKNSKSPDLLRLIQSVKRLDNKQLSQVQNFAEALFFDPALIPDDIENPYRGNFKKKKDLKAFHDLLHLIEQQITGDEIEALLPKQLDEWQLVAVSDLAKCLCRQVQWLIVQIESARFACGQSIKKQEEQWCQKAIQIHKLFNRLSRRMNPSDTDSSSHCRQMMETQMSTIYGIQNDWHKAHECLDRALGLTSNLGAADSLLNSGIIELHRAQLFLLHARSLGNGIIPETRRNLLRLLHRVARGNYSRGLEGLKKSEQEIIDYLKDAKKYWKKKGIKKPSKATPEEKKKWKTDLSSGRRLLEDAEASLKKAELALVQKRKNVWWSTWLFELQAKVVEYRLLFSIHERVHHLAWKSQEDLRDLITSTRAGIVPIPDFGSNSSPRSEPTILDEALENTLRMVRLDLVRLSRVVESYAFCHWALSVLIQLSPDLEWLPTRQEMMRKALGADRQRTAIEILQSKIKRRTSMPPVLDPFAHAYAENTLQLARDVVDFTPIHGGS